MPDLDNEITHLEKLHRLRQDARFLWNQAVDVLISHEYVPRSRQSADTPTPTRPGWRLPGDEVEKALLLRALRGKLAQEGEKTRANLVEDLRSMTLAECEAVEDSTKPTTSYDRVPILRAAVVMQALLETPGCGLSEGVLACFYRIVQELYEVVPPTWTAGAARAGDGALASAFITGECGRALLALERALNTTARAAELLGNAAAHMRKAPPNVALWLKQDKLFRAQSLRVSLGALRPYLIVDLPQEGEDDPCLLLRQLVVACKAPAPQLKSSRVGNETTRHLVQASHNIAREAVSLLGETAKEVAGFEEEVESDPGAIGQKVSVALQAAAQRVRRLLEPVEHFASSVIDRELAAASPHLGRPVDAAELVFAAALYGRLSQTAPGALWTHPKVKAAVDLVSTLLTPDGRLPSLLPFNVLTQGYRLHVTSLEVTRRLAELVANVEVEPEPPFVERLMRPFYDTRALSRDSLAPGWAADPAGPESESEWWATALAADALDWVTRMLDASINRQVLRHFSVRIPSGLKRGLDDLFYPDFGISAKKAEESVAVKLQRLRAHASSGPPEKTPLFSLILYGPPGTGKTTLVEALAKSAGVPFVEITPSDILVGGAEAVERRTRLVFMALSMLTHAVILFDEFDSILQDRGRTGDAPPQTVFEFLTPGLLPKLKRLYDAAEDQRVSYVLATNFVFRLDGAVIRKGRFDTMHGIYPPDVVSRLGRGLDQFQKAKARREKGNGSLDETERYRVLEVVKKTAGAPMAEIAKLDWYSASKVGGDLPGMHREAVFDGKWAGKTGEESGNKLLTQYWGDWQTIEDWDHSVHGCSQQDTLDWDRLVEEVWGHK